MYTFENALDSYESRSDCISNYNVTKSKKEIEEIKRDVENSFQFRWKVDKAIILNLKSILFQILETIPMQYTQGMCEIGSIIIYHYFRFDFKNEDDGKVLEVDATKLKRAKYAITNIFYNKLQPLMDDKLKLYKHYNTIMMKMLEKRNIKLDELGSYIYMKDLMSWMVKSINSFEDTKIIFAQIISVPSNSPFLLLVHFYEFISNEKPIEGVNDELYKALVFLEKEFLDIESEMARSEGTQSRGTMVSIIGTGIAIGAAIFIGFMIHKNNKRD